ncbi:MAG TPA: hypothetical protein VM165_08100, partial [Planctomycetaceae bacterium]|nr:hypothetical protein [Planctomycetaceae bacterium]
SEAMGCDGMPRLSLSNSLPRAAMLKQRRQICRVGWAHQHGENGVRHVINIRGGHSPPYQMN